MTPKFGEVWTYGSSGPMMIVRVEEEREDSNRIIQRCQVAMLEGDTPLVQSLFWRSRSKGSGAEVYATKWVRKDEGEPT